MVEEVTASAQSLSDMAQTLQRLVAQFKLGEVTSTKAPAEPLIAASRIIKQSAPVVLGVSNGKNGHH
jgi:hypothetical protein